MRDPIHSNAFHASHLGTGRVRQPCGLREQRKSCDKHCCRKHPPAQDRFTAWCPRGHHVVCTIATRRDPQWAALRARCWWERNSLSGLLDRASSALANQSREVDVGKCPAMMTGAAGAS